MPVDDHKMYKKRASMFINTNGKKFQSSADLDRFTMEDAGFYTFVFSQKADNDQSSNLFTSGQRFPFRIVWLFLLVFFPGKLPR
jgi:hypothetical protein